MRRGFVGRHSKASCDQQAAGFSLSRSLRAFVGVTEQAGLLAAVRVLAAERSVDLEDSSLSKITAGLWGLGVRRIKVKAQRDDGVCVVSKVKAGGPPTCAIAGRDAHSA